MNPFDATVVKNLFKDKNSTIIDMDHLIIELAKPEHLEFIWNLDRQLILEEIEHDSKYLPKGYYDPYLCATKTELYEKIVQNKWYVIYIDKYLVGTYQILDTSTITCDLYEFSSFIIDKDIRGVGIGSIVMKRLIKQHGKKLLVTNVSPRNEGFYKKFGLGICKSNMCIQ